MKRQRLILTEVNYISESILLSNQTNLVCHGNAPEISEGCRAPIVIRSQKSLGPSVQVKIVQYRTRSNWKRSL